MNSCSISNLGGFQYAVIGITKNIGFMYAQKGIRCNTIAPEATITNIASTIRNVNEFGASRTKVTQGVIPRAGQPEEIAQVALFLTIDESSFVNGAVIAADGGWTAKEFICNNARLLDRKRYDYRPHLNSSIRNNEL